jgi:predicted ATP-dependent Lon-type protease
MTFVEDFLSKYTFSYNPRNIESLLLGLGIKDTEGARKAIRLGSDPKYFQVFMAYNDKAKLITRIMQFNTDKYGVRLTFQNGLSVKLSPKVIAETADDFFDLLDQWFIVNVERDEIGILVKSVKPVKPKTDVDIDEDFLKKVEAEVPLYVFLITAFGYKMPSRDKFNVYRDYILGRFIHLFRPSSNIPLHVAELSNRGTGKTTTFLIMRDFLGYYYTTEPPTLPFLVYDSKTKQQGIVATKNGVIFDEVQDWSGDRVKAILSVLDTGMENCTWNRSVSGSSETINRCIPIVFLGNENYISIDFYQAPSSLEQYIAEKSSMLEEVLLSKYPDIFPTRAFLDRFARIAVGNNFPSFTETVTGKVLFPTILRKLIRELQSRIDRESPLNNDYEGRTRRRVEDVGQVLKGLGAGLDKPELVYAWTRFVGVQ